MPKEISNSATFTETIMMASHAKIINEIILLGMHPAESHQIIVFLSVTCKDHTLTVLSNEELNKYPPAKPNKYLLE